MCFRRRPFSSLPSLATYLNAGLSGGSGHHLRAARSGGSWAVGSRQTRRRHTVVPHQAGTRWSAASVPGSGLSAAPQLPQGGVVKISVAKEICHNRCESNTCMLEQGKLLSYDTEVFTLQVLAQHPTLKLRVIIPS